MNSKHTYYFRLTSSHSDELFSYRKQVDKNHPDAYPIELTPEEYETLVVQIDGQNYYRLKS